ncbi:MAG: ABC transporter ATP-binding protein [Candidatus Moranbacteria bacterium]|nr:ABC transporter ATP-binding protein [Candidatus Moranbacteria bacterium]
MPNALSIQQVSKTYASGAHALESVDLNVESGDFFGLLGPNGAGKSTLINIVSGLVTKTGGKVGVFEYDFDKQVEKAKACLGVVPQEFNFNIFETVENIVVNQAGYYGVSRADAKRSTQSLLKQLDLWDKRDQPSRTLSGGMKRRLMIARALVHHPKLLILDEPTAGVDVELRRSMWDFLRKLNEEGMTIILTTHYLEEAEQLCRHLSIINQGNIVEQGSVKDLLSKLHQETFTVDAFTDVGPDVLQKLQAFKARSVDANTFELNTSDEQSLNDVMRILDVAGIRVRSMRGKTNRLEELFVNLTHTKHV